MGVGLGIFAVALAIQVGIGHHNILEPDGRDDADIHGAEFKHTDKEPSAAADGLL